jgi:hypothetical protein
MADNLIRRERIFRNSTANQWRNVMPPIAQAAKKHQMQSPAEHKTVGSRDQIAVAAYYHAEHRGFNGGDPVADWLAAETEINATQKKGKADSTH